MENEKVKNKINELELYASTMLNDKYITLSKKNLSHREIHKVCFYLYKGQKS